MECLYAPELAANSDRIILNNDEARHARALRLREGERIKLTNGSGLCAVAVVEELRNNEVQCRVQELLPNDGEYPYRIIVALGVLDNRERMEFALEKAIELGAHDFVPLLTDHSERNRTKAERLHSKAIAAMKQAHRARLITIHEPMSPKELLSLLPTDTVLLLADADGEKPHQYTASTVCLCVGAEGGFSEAEQSMFLSDARIMRWNLAPTRLRAETALLTGLAALALFHSVGSPS